jgi:hypothetical protein
MRVCVEVLFIYLFVCLFFCLFSRGLTGAREGSIRRAVETRHQNTGELPAGASGREVRDADMPPECASQGSVPQPPQTPPHTTDLRGVDGRDLPRPSQGSVDGRLHHDQDAVVDSSAADGSGAGEPVECRCRGAVACRGSGGRGGVGEVLYGGV